MTGEESGERKQRREKRREEKRRYGGMLDISVNINYINKYVCKLHHREVVAYAIYALMYIK